MTRRSWVQVDGVLYEKGTEPQPERLAPDVMPDIQPYRSMANGEIINSRSRHREHLRDLGFEEVGNDSSLHCGKQPLQSTNREQLREILRAQVNDMTDEQFKAAGRRDLERLRWNSRQD